MRRTLKASLFIGLAALGCFLLVKLIWFGPDSEVFPEFDFSQGEAVFQELEQKIFTGAWKAEEYSEVEEPHQRQMASSKPTKAELCCISATDWCL